MHRLRSSIAWMTLVASASAACTFDLREERIEGAAAATEPERREFAAANGDEPIASDASSDGVATPEGGSAPGTVTCYADEDGDGYPSFASSITTSGACPAPFVQKRADAKFDCDDDDQDVHPGQQGYFSDPSCPGTFDYDYDCDGKSTSNLRPVLYCSVLPPAECAGAVEALGFNAATINSLGCGSKFKGSRCTFTAQGTCIYSSILSDVQISCR